MKRIFSVKSGIVLAMVVLTGFATYAFAGQGKGQRSHGMNDADCPRYGMGPGAEGRGWMGANLTDEQKKQFEKERSAFWDATADLRQKIQEKHAALGAELVKKTPSAETASAIQKEISALEAEFDQQRLQHHLKMKETFPGLGAMGMGWHQGFRGHGGCRGWRD